MKQTAIAFLLVSLACGLAAADRKFTVALGAGVLLPIDAGFRELYGSALFCPELRLSVELMPRFCAWLAGSSASATGVLPELGDEIKASQTFLSLGAGWETRRKGRLQAEAGAAFLMANSREKAMGARASRWAPGFDARAGLRYFFKDAVFIGLNVGFAGAWTAVDTGESEKDIVIGGIRLGASLGYRF
jgi:hypothetical protein